MLLLTSVGQMLTTFAGSALNVGFPSIEADLGVRRSTLTWTITGYAVAAAALLLVAGRAADRVGGRRVFLAGMWLFMLGALAAAMAPGIEMLIVARVAQGAGAAAMIPSSLTIALHAFPAARRSLAIAVWGGIAAIAGASGPPVGAALIELGSWRLVFAASVPLCVAIVVLGLRLLPEVAPSASAGRVDVVSGPLASASVALVIVAMLEGGRWGWSDPRIAAALIGAVALMALVLRRSATHPTPVLDLALFRDRRFAVASTMTTVYNASTGGYWLAAPIFLQLVWGWSVLESGFGIALSPVTHLFLAGPMGRLADRGHHRLLMVGGVLLTAAGTGGLALFVAEDSSYVTSFVPFIIMIGAGGSAAWATFTSAALVDVAPRAVRPSQRHQPHDAAARWCTRGRRCDRGDRGCR